MTQLTLGLFRQNREKEELGALLTPAKTPGLLSIWPHSLGTEEEKTADISRPSGALVQEGLRQAEVRDCFRWGTCLSTLLNRDLGMGKGRLCSWQSPHPSTQTLQTPEGRKGKRGPEVLAGRSAGRGIWRTGFWGGGSSGTYSPNIQGYCYWIWLILRSCAHPRGVAWVYSKPCLLLT